MELFLFHAEVIQTEIPSIILMLLLQELCSVMELLACIEVLCPMHWKTYQIAGLLSFPFHYLHLWEWKLWSSVMTCLLDTDEPKASNSTISSCRRMLIFGIFVQDFLVLIFSCKNIFYNWWSSELSLRLIPCRVEHWKTQWFEDEVYRLCNRGHFWIWNLPFHSCCSLCGKYWHLPQN